MAEKLKFTSALYRSAFSAKTYREAASSSFERLLAYLSLLVLIATIVSAVSIHLGIIFGLQKFQSSRWWENNIKEVRIEKGRASSPVDQPCFKSIGGAFIAVIDTTGKITATDYGYKWDILLTERELCVRHGSRGSETRILRLTSFPDVVIDQEMIEKWGRLVVAFGWLPIAIAIFGCTWLGKLFQVIFWSLLGLIINALGGRRLRYVQLLNIGILALTVSIALTILLEYFTKANALLNTFQGPSLIILLFMPWRLAALPVYVYVGYFIWGILAQPKPAGK